MADDATPLLKIIDLAVSFRGPGGSRVHAVRGINLSVYPGQTLAIVGESGSGKSVSAMSILRLVPTPPGRYDSGQIIWYGDEQFDGRDLLTMADRDLRRIRGNHIAMIFQEPMTSLNPVYTIGEQIMEAIRLHQQVDRAGATERAVKALDEVGIAEPRARLNEYPHQLSGGMRQRVMIAMALACQPDLLLADEPTTALDVTIQAQILELLRKLQVEHQMAVMLITHDLGVVAENADVVAVMNNGRVVEYASVEDIFNNPLHAYTRGLFSSMPVIGRHQQRLAALQEDAMSSAEGETGEPLLIEVEPSHWVAMPPGTGGPQTVPDLAYRRAAPAAQ